jgi:DNA-binding GntR family transcriptional regulator
VAVSVSRAEEPSSVLSVMAHVRQGIFVGHLRGGDPVREEVVARELGVSRTPVREAIGRLIAEGILTKDGNRSAVVFKPSVQDLLEIYEIREPLETLAASLAADQATDAFTGELRAQFAELQSAPVGMDWMRAHEAFHLKIFSGGNRSRLLVLIQALRAQSEPYVRFATQVDSRFRERSMAQHADMVAAIQARDRRAMERLVRKHLAATSARVTELLESGLLIPSFDPRAFSG